MVQRKSAASSLALLAVVGGGVWYFMAFEKEAPTPADALEAFNELAYQVTGPGGFWRKEVPNRWLGCKNQPESASCGAIDVMSEEIARLGEPDAGRFVDEHEAAMQSDGML